MSTRPFFGGGRQGHFLQNAAIGGSQQVINTSGTTTSTLEGEIVASFLHLGDPTLAYVGGGHVNKKELFATKHLLNSIKTIVEGMDKYSEKSIVQLNSHIFLATEDIVDPEQPIFDIFLYNSSGIAQDYDPTVKRGTTKSLLTTRMYTHKRKSVCVAMDPTSADRLQKAIEGYRTIENKGLNSGYKVSQADAQNMNAHAQDMVKVFAIELGNAKQSLLKSQTVMLLEGVRDMANNMETVQSIARQVGSNPPYNKDLSPSNMHKNQGVREAFEWIFADSLTRLLENVNKISRDPITAINELVETSQNHCIMHDSYDAEPLMIYTAGADKTMKKKVDRILYIPERCYKAILKKTGKYNGGEVFKTGRLEGVQPYYFKPNTALVDPKRHELKFMHCYTDENKAPKYLKDFDLSALSKEERSRINRNALAQLADWGMEHINDQSTQNPETKLEYKLGDIKYDGNVFYIDTSPETACIVDVVPTEYAKTTLSGNTNTICHVRYGILHNVMATVMDEYKKLRNVNGATYHGQSPFSPQEPTAYTPSISGSRYTIHHDDVLAAFCNDKVQCAEKELNIENEHFFQTQHNKEIDPTVKKYYERKSQTCSQYSQIYKSWLDTQKWQDGNAYQEDKQSDEYGHLMEVETSPFFQLTFNNETNEFEMKRRLVFGDIPFTVQSGDTVLVRGGELMYQIMQNNSIKIVEKLETISEHISKLDELIVDETGNVTITDTGVDVGHLAIDLKQVANLIHNTFKNMYNCQNMAQVSIIYEESVRNIFQHIICAYIIPALCKGRVQIEDHSDGGGKLVVRLAADEDNDVYWFNKTLEDDSDRISQVHALNVRHVMKQNWPALIKIVSAMQMTCKTTPIAIKAALTSGVHPGFMVTFYTVIPIKTDAMLCVNPHTRNTLIGPMSVKQNKTKDSFSVEMIANHKSCACDVVNGSIVYDQAHCSPSALIDNRHGRVIHSMDSPFHRVDGRGRMGILDMLNSFKETSLLTNEDIELIKKIYDKHIDVYLEEEKKYSETNVSMQFRASTEFIPIISPTISKNPFITEYHSVLGVPLYYSSDIMSPEFATPSTSQHIQDAIGAQRWARSLSLAVAKETLNPYSSNLTGIYKIMHSGHMVVPRGIGMFTSHTDNNRYCPNHKKSQIFATFEQLFSADNETQPVHQRDAAAYPAMLGTEYLRSNAELSGIVDRKQSNLPVRDCDTTAKQGISVPFTYASHDEFLTQAYVSNPRNQKEALFPKQLISVNGFNATNNTNHFLVKSPYSSSGVVNPIDKI